jgi:hypothetical protein
MSRGDVIGGNLFVRSLARRAYIRNGPALPMESSAPFLGGHELPKFRCRSVAGVQYEMGPVRANNRFVGSPSAIVLAPFNSVTAVLALQRGGGLPGDEVEPLSRSSPFKSL